MSKTKKKKFGTKDALIMFYLGIFRAATSKTFVIFEITTLQFAKTQTFMQK